MAEFALALAVIALRAIADYVPNSDVSKPGDESPAKGAHPLTMLTATLFVYFVLALGARSRIMGRACLLFGALMDLTLMLRSRSELQTVAGWFAAMPTKKSTPASGGTPPSDSTPPSNLPPIGPVET